MADARDQNSRPLLPSSTADGGVRIPLQISRFTQHGEAHRLQENGLTDPAAAEYLRRWIAAYCGSWVGGTDWTVESFDLPFPIGPSQISLLAVSLKESVAVIIVGELVGVTELCGLIIAGAASVPASDRSHSEDIHVLVLCNQVTRGLNQVQRFLRGHGIRAEALPTRVFRDANGDFLIITNCPEPDPESISHNGYAIESELEIFGDPVLAIVHNAAR